jgi:hypothetical protein
MSLQAKSKQFHLITIPTCFVLLPFFLAGNSPTYSSLDAGQKQEHIVPNFAAATPVTGSYRW